MVHDPTNMLNHIVGSHLKRGGEWTLSVVGVFALSSLVTPLLKCIELLFAQHFELPQL